MWSGQSPVPVTPDILAEYTIYLSWNVRSAVTVMNHISSIRVLAEAHGCMCWESVVGHVIMKHVIAAVKKRLLSSAIPRRAFTPEHLLQMSSQMSPTDPRDLAMWSAMSLGFFGMLRAGNLTPASCKAAFRTTAHHLRRGDISFHKHGINIKVRYSKTNQAGARSVIIPVAAIPNHPLCPVKCVQQLLSCSKLPDAAPLFSISRSDQQWILTRAQFNRRLKLLVSQIGLCVDSYSGHSLRRGGATFAYALDLPVQLIMLQGDWRSDAVKRYLQMTGSQQLDVPRAMAKNFH